MKRKSNIRIFLSLFFLSALITLLVAPDIAEARRGGGFGGRRSFGGRSRSSRSRAKSSKPRMSKAQQQKQRVATQKKTPSFGGKRISQQQARSKYGTPRKTTTTSGKNQYGTNQNYRVNHYGGYGSGLMTGYMMGSITSSMMWMPWRGCFWYSRPHYTDPDANGVVGVYPPSFNYSKAFFTVLILLILVYVLFRVFSKPKNSGGSHSSFG